MRERERDRERERQRERDRERERLRERERQTERERGREERLLFRDHSLVNFVKCPEGIWKLYCILTEFTMRILWNFPRSV